MKLPIHKLILSAAIAAASGLSIQAGELESMQAGMATSDFPIWAYSIRLPVQYGYDDNPTGLSRDLPRREGLSHRSSSLIHLNPSVEFTMVQSELISWAFSYDLLKIYYLDQADINVTNNTFELSRTQKIGEHKLVVSVSDEIDRVDEEGQSNQFKVRPTWKHKWDDCWSTDFAYTFAWTDVALADDGKVPAVLDPDNKYHAVGLIQTYTFPSSELKVSLGYQFFVVKTEGSVADKQRHRIYSKLAGKPFPIEWKRLNALEVEVTYTHDFDDYENKDVGAPAGFNIVRSENIDAVSLTLTYPLGWTVQWEEEDSSGRRRGPVQAKWIAGYEYSNQDSNIRGRNSDNHIFRAGIVADF